jgi:glycyl-tRNA synthetase beta chain
LAGLREPVDAFFDGVMVMADDEATKANRLALLARLRALFLRLADVSRLA